MKHDKSRRTRGHTLLEMVLGLTIVGIISVSVGTAMVFIAQASPQTDSGLPTLAEQTQALNQMADDLASARYVIERRQRAVTVVVDDRTGDGLADRIRYAWDGSAGDPLTYQLNDATPVVLLDEIGGLTFAYATTAVTTTLATDAGGGGGTSDGPEQLLAVNDDTSSFGFFPMQSSHALGQRFTPTLSASAIGFKITRVELYGQQSGSSNGTFPVQLRDITGDTPTGPVYATATARENDMSRSTQAWFEVAFADSEVVPAGEEKVLTMGFGSGGGRQGQLLYDVNGAPPRVLSLDDNASWQSATYGGGVLCRVYGVEVYGGGGAGSASYDVTRDHVSGIQVAFQVNGAGQPPLSRSVAMSQAPEVLDKFWDADFAGDPTAMDLDANGSADWVYVGGAFPAGSLSGGVWTAGNDLRAQPNLFGVGNTIELITIDLRMRATTTDGPLVCGPMQVIGNDVMPLITQLRQDGVGGQELLIYNSLVPTNPVKTVTGLAQGWVDVRLSLLPKDESVSVRVNGQDTGGVALNWVSDPGITKTVWFGTAGSGAEYDEVRVGVGGSAVLAANPITTEQSSGQGGESALNQLKQGIESLFE